VTLAPVAALFPEGVADALIALRRDIHQHPELGFAERDTAERLQRALATVPGARVRRVAGTGVVARIPGRSPAGPVLAIRGDIDALPIQEETGVPYASQVAGVMHACGHDIHATWAVGAAHLLAHEPAAGEVVILLQPAEETGRGAPAVLETDALDGVAAIFAGHVDMRFPVGTVVAEPGPLAGSTDEFTITIEGRGGHAARPHEARDPIATGAHLVVALQTIVARRLPPGEPAVVTVGTFTAGTAPNVIPAVATLTGTLRAVHPDTRAALRHEMTQMAEAVAATHGLDAHVEILPGTPPIVNPPGPVAWARAAVEALLGREAFVSLPEPNLGGEDFACYLERIPGCFLRFGAGQPDDGTPPAAHTSTFLPREEAIFVGAAVLAETARRASAALAAG
jgi:hippurate hydrolase